MSRIAEKAGSEVSHGSSSRGAGERPHVALVMREVNDRGGMERVHAEMIRRLSDRYRFTVLAARMDPDLLEHADWVKVPTPSRPQPLGNFRFFFLGTLYARSLNVDLVHSCGAVIGSHVDVSTVHFCHAGFRAQGRRLSPQGAPLLRRVNTGLNRLEALLFERWCYRPGRARHLVAVSSRVKDEVQCHYPAAIVTCLPNGVDTQHFRPDPQIRDRVRNDVNVRPDDVVAIFVGGDWDRKGLGVAIEAVARARGVGAPVSLWVVGEGDRTRFEKQARRYDVAGAVTFWGFATDPSHLYQGADVYVGPSSYETFSLAMLEAAASGLPVVTTDVGIARELAGSREPGQVAGTIVDRDPVAVSEALMLLSDRSLRQAWGSVARRRSLDFSWEEMARRTDRLYQGLLRSALPVMGDSRG